MWGGVRCQTSLLSSFPCPADHERNCPPCKLVFFGLATNTLNVVNKNINNYSDTVCVSHMSTLSIIGVGKERRTLVGPWGYLKRLHPLLELPVNAIGTQLRDLINSGLTR